HPRRQTQLFRAVKPLEPSVRQPLHDHPHRSDSLLVRGESALIPPSVQEGVDWLISGKRYGLRPPLTTRYARTDGGEIRAVTQQGAIGNFSWRREPASRAAATLDSE